MSSGMTLEIDKELVEPVVREQIRLAIVRELNNTDRLIEKVVAEALGQKVDYQGKVSRSSYDNKYSFLEWVAKDVIRSAAKQAVREYIESQSKQIQAEVERQLKFKAKGFAKAIVEGVEGCLDAKWSFRVNVDFKAQD